MPDDAGYLDIFLTPLRVCRAYKPKFGHGADGDTTIQDFRALYGSDPLYHWVGFDSDLMYAAHKAAGGITSVYRQLGIGCERLLRTVMQDAAGLSDEDVLWAFTIEKEDGSTALLKLDARLPLSGIADGAIRERVEVWIAQCGEHLGLSRELTRALRGAAFEIRQGYKSADSKRQNADLRFALRAYGETLLPVMMVVSSQVNQMVQRRYHAANLLVLVGTLSHDPFISTFAFFEQVLGYDLAGFFQRHSDSIRTEVQGILVSLLSPAG